MGLKKKSLEVFLRLVQTYPKANSLKCEALWCHLIKKTDSAKEEKRQVMKKKEEREEKQVP